ncbi:MAG: GNAT family N-acetyltransferase [Desulfobulbaceae bacterium]|nr:GNAT family N-acetyltransferase [Desulfobulbaceae bacterium]
MKISDNLCQFLEWDSSFFGCRIGSLTVHHLTPEIVIELEQWRRCNNIACVYFFAHPNDPSTIRLAEASRFQLVDFQVVYEFTAEGTVLAPKPPMTDSVVRVHEQTDIGDLVAIARTSHGNTRFYNDSHFSREQADFFYEKWIVNSCSGWADEVFVAEVKGEVAGYVSCHLDHDNYVGKIGLLGVKSSLRSRGIGQQLLFMALLWQKSKGAKVVLVTTQAGNIAAQRLYQQSGFIISKGSLVYHSWTSS